MGERTDMPRYHLATVTIAPQWQATVRKAIDIFMAKNPKATEAQALDQILVNGAINVVRAADRATS